MKSKLTFIISVSLLLLNMQASAQQMKIYPVTSGEMIFSQSSASFTQEFLDQYPNARLAANNVRYTVFFHIGQYIHFDFNNMVGLYSGLAIRNVGMITDESLPQTVSLTGDSSQYTDYKIIRRQYTLGIPLALKLGSFSKHLYFFGGAEAELAFHFKEKYWTGEFDRDDSKTKDKEWFANQTPTILPSVFAGMQFPRGINLKFKYYLTDFLDSGYKVSSNSHEGAIFNVSDLSRYGKSDVFYFSLCWQFRTDELFGE
jgi:hypothetical protein